MRYLSNSITESVQHAAIVGVPVMFNEKVEHIIVCEDEMVSPCKKGHYHTFSASPTP